MSGASSGTSKTYFEETWFELIFVAGCFVVAYLLFQGLMPPVGMSDATIQDVAMAKLFAEGRILDAFMHFSQSPGYPILLALLIKAWHTVDLYRLTDAALQLNLGLYLASIGLVYAFIRRQIRKPYVFIITALYVVAPATLGMAWTLGPAMAYLTFSMAALVAIDQLMGRETAESGQISRGELLLCGALMGFSILLKPVGYLLLVAFFLIMLKRCGLKKSALALSMVVLCLSPFVGRDLYTVLRQPDPYLQSSVKLVESARQQGMVATVRQYADDAVRNITQQAVGELNLSLLGSERPGSRLHRIGVGHQPWGRWILGSLAILGTLYGLYLYTGVGSLYLAGHLLAALVLLPEAEIGLASASPLILFSLYFGVMRVGEWMKKLHLPVSRIASPALTVWILLCTLSNHWGQASVPALAPTPSLPASTQAAHAAAAPEPRVVYMSTVKKPESRLEKAQLTSARRRALNWLDHNTPQDARVAIPRPEAAARLAREMESGDTSGPMRRELGGYDYLVEEAANELAPIGADVTQTRGLKLVYEDLPGKIRIWQIQSRGPALNP